MKRKIWTLVVSTALGLLPTLTQAQVRENSDNLIAANFDSSILKKPTPGTFTDRPTTASGDYSNPALAYDGNLATASVGDVTEGVKGAKSEIETWSGFSAAPPHASGIMLNITSQAQIMGPQGFAQLSYSLNGGSTFTTIYLLDSGSRSKQTDMVSLSNSQDLTKVQVKGEVTAFDVTGTPTTSIQDIYEISITGSD